MASFLQDIGLLEAVLADVEAFASGSAVATSVTVGADLYDVSVILLPTGPVAPYAEISGSFWSIIVAALSYAATIATGGTLQLAVKENRTWYGVTLSAKPKSTI
jgi:hypothetical protein